MSCPIESSYRDLVGLFPHPCQQPVLDSPDYRTMFQHSKEMVCSCCPLGREPVNINRPPVMESGTYMGRIFLIGEAPGQNERETGHAFIGKAGRLLHKMTCSKEGAALPVEAIYLSNILKCRPTDKIHDVLSGRERLEDRTPKKAEMDSCFPLLLKQISFARGIQIIGFIGGTSAKYCLGLNSKFTVLKNIGKGIPVRIGDRWIYTVLLAHTSYLLQNKGDKDTYAANRAVLWRMKRFLNRETELFEYTPLDRSLFSKDSTPTYFEVAERNKNKKVENEYGQVG